MIACLQGQRGGLSKQCRATLFNHEVRLAGASRRGSDAGGFGEMQEGRSVCKLAPEPLLACPLPELYSPFLALLPLISPPSCLPTCPPCRPAPPGCTHTEDIDFKFPLQQACVTEVALMCRGVTRGHARVVRCLEGHLESDRMSQECREAVEKDEVRGRVGGRL